MSDEPNGKTKLTSKQRLFVEVYLECWNATEAARQAGYQGTDDTLAGVGYQNVRKPQIAQKISERIQASCMSTDEALAILAMMARFDPGEFLDLDGETPTFNLALLKKANLTQMLKSITPTRYGVKIELHDPLAALEKILKAGGAYKDKGDAPKFNVQFDLAAWTKDRSQRLDEVAQLDDGETQDG